ncbi:TPA: CRISPR-associated DxTHG motif protein [Serratia marcescens]
MGLDISHIFRYMPTYQI